MWYSLTYPRVGSEVGLALRERETPGSGLQKQLRHLAARTEEADAAADLIAAHGWWARYLRQLDAARIDGLLKRREAPSEVAI
jgi:hypothetical protein